MALTSPSSLVRWSLSSPTKCDIQVAVNFVLLKEEGQNGGAGPCMDRQLSCRIATWMGGEPKVYQATSATRSGPGG